MFVSVDIGQPVGQHCRSCVRGQQTGSPSAATTTPSSGPAPPGTRTWSSCGPPASRSSRWECSPGRGSSRRRASTTSPGSTRSWACCTRAASPWTSPPPPPPHRPGCRRHTRRSSPSIAMATRCGRAADRRGAPALPVYREHALALTAQLARRYHEHPALALWHVSNEYACHNLPCYCDTCAAAFRGWLRGRYGALEALNDAWGTAFWSQRYTDWDQVLPPRRTTTFRQPDAPARLRPVRLRHAARLLPAGEGRPRRALPRRAGDDELHDPHQLPAPRLPRLGPRAGRRQHRPLRHRVPRAPPRRARVRCRPHPRPGRRRTVDAHGALDERGQLAAGEPRQGAGADHPRQPCARRPRRRRHRVLPVAAVAGRLGEVPLRARPARRAGQRPLPRGVRARCHRGPARRAARLPGGGRRRRPVGLPGRVGGVRPSHAVGETSSTPWSGRPSTGCCGTAASPRTSCTRAPT